MAKTAGANQDSATLLIPNSRDKIEQAEQALLAALERHAYGEAARFAVRLAMEEALVNAFRHGHKGLPPETPVQLEYNVTPDRVYLNVQDQGPGFNPGVVPDPTLDENLELPTGRGLLLMRAYMEKVEYVGTGNRVEMIYKRPTEG